MTGPVNEPIGEMHRRDVLRVIGSGAASVASGTPDKALDTLAGSGIFPAGSQSLQRLLPIAHQLVSKLPEMVANCMRIDCSFSGQLSINNFVLNTSKSCEIVEYAGRAAENWDCERKELFQSFRKVNAARAALMNEAGWSDLYDVLRSNWSRSWDSLVQKTFELIGRLPRDLPVFEENSALLDQFVASVKAGTTRFESRSEYRLFERVTEIVDVWEYVATGSSQDPENFVGLYERWLHSVRQAETSLLQEIGLDSHTIEQFYAGMAKTMEEQTLSSALFSNRVGLLNIGNEGLSDIPLFSSEFERGFGMYSRKLGESYAKVRRKLSNGNETKSTEAEKDASFEADRQRWFGPFTIPDAWVA